MGLVNWVKDEEYEREIKKYNTIYYREHNDSINNNQEVYKKWRDIYTEDEIRIIADYMQKEINIMRKKGYKEMREWWKDFKMLVEHNAYINLSNAGEFWDFMEILELKRGYKNNEICKKAKKYYLDINYVKFIIRFGTLEERNKRVKERTKR